MKKWMDSVEEMILFFSPPLLRKNPMVSPLTDFLEEEKDKDQIYTRTLAVQPVV